MVTLTPAERVQVAKALGIHEQYLYQCLHGHRPTPPERCPPIERATEGRITCEELRPDVRWQRVPDPAWPHPQGRPCLDVAGPAVAQPSEVRDAA
jgi:hypothetical protein